MTSVGSAFDFHVATRHLRAGDPTSPGAGNTFSDAMQENHQAIDTENDGRPPFIVSFQDKLYNLGKTTLNKMPDSARINIAELPEDRYRSYMEREQESIEMSERALRSQYSSMEELPENDPRNKTYATIVIGGKVVATIDNQGCIGGDNAIMAHLDGLLPDEVNGTNGPALAKARAEAAAAILGGRIIVSSTAISQQQFDALPSMDSLRRLVDYDGMKNDPLYQEIENMRANYQRLEQDRAAYLAKQQSAETAA